MSLYHNIIISWYQSEEGISCFRPKLTNKTEKAFLTPPPRVVEGWNLYVWQWIFEAHLMVTSKHSQVLQNRHFAEFVFGGVDEKQFPTKMFVEYFVLGGKMNCRGSSETRFPQVWGRTEPSSGGKRPFEVSKNVFDVEKWNVGNRPKRVLAKFGGDPSFVRDVNGDSKKSI